MPGVNKKERVSNGNYVWISYFYSYLNEKGRAGFVMSSQASSAGGGEAQVRRQLIESSDVDAMISVRSNFFYTRTVPCELWFLNRDKPEEHRDKVLMIDARNVYRKVTRKIYDFSPEQERNLLAIVWLYRGDTERYLDLVSRYLWEVANQGSACFKQVSDVGETFRPLPEFLEAVSALQDELSSFLKTQANRSHTGRSRGAGEGAEAVRSQRCTVPGPRRQGAGRVGVGDARYQRQPERAGGAVRAAGRNQSRPRQGC